FLRLKAGRNTADDVLVILDGLKSGGTPETSHPFVAVKRSGSSWKNTEATSPLLLILVPNGNIASPPVKRCLASSPKSQSGPSPSGSGMPDSNFGERFIK